MYVQVHTRECSVSHPHYTDNTGELNRTADKYDTQPNQLPIWPNKT